MMGISTLLWIGLIFAAFADARLRKVPMSFFEEMCAQGSCFPATGDLMIARQERLSATSTCGLKKEERYCIMSHLKDRYNRCFICDSRADYDFQHDRVIQRNHRIQNIVSTITKNRNDKWWQAENGMEDVSIRLDLEAEFHFTHLIMTFKTFRPAAMFIERSPDFGKTWKVYRYFSFDCSKYFPGIPQGPPRDLITPICEKKYSGITPISGGQVFFQVLPSNIKITDPYSPVVQDLLKITNLRINFTKLHTLGDNLVMSKEDVKERYYYSLYNMVVRGSCSCYGHAKVCNPIDAHQDNKDMVGAQCQCRHNTKGYNCEQCQDFYHDLPWRPALGTEINACRQCNCHNHSFKCHFDPAVFSATNMTSGGVCDECQDNTMGYYCQECKPYFYLDPTKEITDKNACLSCDCDPYGSTSNGECDQTTDERLGLVAGRCTCKRFVEGQRCDTCMEGYWNLEAFNPDGCEACDCDPLGTIDGGNCDLWTGECRCKRYVGGRRCDQCLPGFWNLSEERQGCLECNCDIGGAYSLNCSKADGACDCRPGITGHQCTEVFPRHFVPAPNYLTYEAEDAVFHGPVEKSKKIAEENRPRTWTGVGHATVYEGTALEFDISNILYSTDYDIIVVYEILGPRAWSDIRLTVDRPDDEEEDFTGPCSNSIHADNAVPLYLSQTERHHVVIPSSCLEKGKHYKIKIEFISADQRYANPEERINIDSIMLIPRVDGHPAFAYGDPRNIKRDYHDNRCGESYYSPLYKDDPSDLCRLILFSYGAAIFDGAKECECDHRGSYDLDCDQIGGQCKCKPNVIGRRCDQCAPGTYGFGPDGCKPCDCNNLGSIDPYCNKDTGQCACRTNAFGRTCSDCERGFWGYPHCRPCACNDLAYDCDFQTGACNNCRNNSGGHNCERCADGYYGHPRKEYGGCKRCTCPTSEVQHADTCREYDRDIYCDCHLGYTGPRCDQCAVGYYGDAVRGEKECKKCQCNDNIDTNDPDSCDPKTGECLKCLYNTEGYQCERCAKGFFGDAATKSCIPCACNILGTNQTLLTACDHATGQCQCLPHVIGKNCDECDINHWKLASGKGCVPCDCDPSGSIYEQCDSFDGQCKCFEGRGGRDCSKCPPLYWGDPIIGCKPCACNRDGAYSDVCDKDTGQCKCHKGITGLQCDRCDRGTTGSLPYCAPCGECFDDWDKYIKELNAAAQDVLKSSKEVKLHGPVSNFTDEFSHRLKQLYDLVEKQDIGEVDFENISAEIIQIKDELAKTDEVMIEQEADLDVMVEHLKDLQQSTEQHQKDYDDLLNEIEDFKNSAQSEQEQNTEGAFQSIQNSMQRTNEILPKKNELNEFMEVIKENLDAYNRAFNDFSSPEEEKSKLELFKNLSKSAHETNEKTLEFNSLVCGGGDEQCDEKCGGANCKKCGGEECMDGLVSKAVKALKQAKEAEEISKKKRTESEKLATETNLANKQCSQSRDEFKKLAEKAELAANSSRDHYFDFEGERNKSQKALDSEYTSYSDIESVTDDTFALKISKSPEELEKFGKEIEETVQGLTQVEEIIRDTEEKIRNYENFKRLAENEKETSTKFKDKVLNLIEVLNNATVTRHEILNYIDESNERIDVLGEKIEEVDKDLEGMQNEFKGPSRRSVEAKERFRKLKESYSRKETNLEIFAKELEGLGLQTEDAQKMVVKLESKTIPLNRKIAARTEPLHKLAEECNEFSENVESLIKDLRTKQRLLQETIQKKARSKAVLENHTDRASALLDRAAKATEAITKSALFHRQCAG